MAMWSSSAWPTAEDFAWANDLISKPEYKDLPTIVTTHDYLVAGGRGLLRLVTIDIPGNKIDVKTFSPGYSYMDEEEEVKVDAFFEEDGNSQFSFNVNLAERFNPKSTFDFGPEPPKEPEMPLSEPTVPYTHIFQQRRGGYEGTVDTQINGNNPNLTYAGEATLTTDLDDSGARVNSMLVFNGIIGGEKGQIKPGSKIQSAKILFHVTSVTLHPWSFVWFSFSYPYA